MYMIKFDNVKLEMKDDGKGGQVESVVDTFLAPLVEELALKHPEWKFEADYNCKRHTENGITWTIERMKITDKYEVLGQIGIDYFNSGKRFWINNHRVQDLRERGSGMKTIHLNKAIRHVEKFFGLKNLDEKLKEARQQARETIDNIAREKYYAFNNVWRTIEGVGQQFLLEHMEAFKAATKDTPAFMSVEKFPEVRHELTHSNNVRDLVNTGKAYLVFIDGMNYSVSLGQSQPEIMSSEELPDFIRRGVGMLKLVEKQTMITNIGFRADENTFVVLPPSEEEHE
jgi:hypothetical protein